MSAQSITAYFQERDIQVNRTPGVVLRKARRLVEQLEAGAPYWKLHGKRMAWNRALISIPIGRKWRLMAEDVDGHILPKQVISHARYNDLGGQRHG